MNSKQLNGLLGWRSKMHEIAQESAKKVVNYTDAKSDQLPWITSVFEDAMRKFLSESLKEMDK